jgi:hypothetical protein
MMKEEEESDTVQEAQIDRQRHTAPKRHTYKK